MIIILKIYNAPFPCKYYQKEITFYRYGGLNNNTYVRVSLLRRNSYLHFTQQIIFISIAAAAELNCQGPAFHNINRDISPIISLIRKAGEKKRK